MDNKDQMKTGMSFNQGSVSDVMGKVKWTPGSIRCLRLRMGWSQSDLARRLDLNPQTIADWETEAVLPLPQKLEILDLIEKQAQMHAEATAISPIAERECEEKDLMQVDVSRIE